MTYFGGFRQRVGELVLLSFIVGFQVLAGGQMCPRHEVGFNWIQNPVENQICIFDGPRSGLAANESRNVRKPDLIEIFLLTTRT